MAKIKVVVMLFQVTFAKFVLRKKIGPFLPTNGYRSSITIPLKTSRVNT